MLCLAPFSHLHQHLSKSNEPDLAEKGGCHRRSIRARFRYEACVCAIKIFTLPHTDLAGSLRQLFICPNQIPG